MVYRTVLLFTLALFTVRCSKTESARQLGAEVAIGAGIGTLSSAANLSTTIPTSLSRTVSQCGVSAFADTCASGTKQASYSNCVSATGAKYSGTVTLGFFTSSAGDPSCNLTSNGNYVIRTFDLTRSETTIQLHATSATHTDYRGNSISGGYKATKSGKDTYVIEILGSHRVAATAAGLEVYDVSIRTLSSVLLDASSANQSLSGGQVEVAHNIAKYVAVFSPVSLSFGSSNCCYPSAGSINVEYAGSIVGKGTLSFDGQTCGNVSFAREGQSATTVALAGCE